jgi:hypothetical protein
VRAFLSAVLFLAAASVLADAKPSIENLSATFSGHKVSVRFKLANVFANRETNEALQSGLPTGFTYFIEIFRDRPNWLDDGISTVRVEVISTFNSVTREYLLNYRRDRHLVRSDTFTDLAGLEKAMTAIEELELFDIGGRKPYKLKVRVKADVERGWLMYLIPWDVSTRWSETRVKPAEPR